MDFSLNSSTFSITECGIAKVSSPAFTSKAWIIDKVNGKVIRNVEPFPTTLSNEIVPFKLLIFSLTTSIPTPRPDTPVTSLFVEKPAWKIS